MPPAARLSTDPTVRAADVRKRPRDVEGPIHRAVLAFLRAVLPAGWLIHHSPNGGTLKGDVGRAKGLGTLAGWPDLMIVGRLDDVTFVGCMEIKAERGRLSEDQRAVCDRLMDCGISVRIIRSVEDARKAVADWGLPSREVTR